MSEAAAPPQVNRQQQMQALAERLYPLPRSLTGQGVRETLSILSEELPLEVREVPTGTAVLDWTVPREWNVREAWIEGPDGTRVVDFRDSNLHLVGYSTPVRTRLGLSELKQHLHTLPEHPDWIPYRTSYWKEAWGFCLEHRRLEALPEGDYEVCIDASLEDGHLSYGELLLPGDREQEVLVSTHVCHPSLANDNVSGIVVAATLARQLMERPRRLTYRFLFVPGTIGPITWLARNEQLLDRVRHGLVLALLGRPGRFVYKRSRRGDADIDGVAARALGDNGEVRDFEPYGYDERQYCSPGFDLPVGRLTRAPHGEFPEYHTSADDLELLRPAALVEAVDTVAAIFDLLERDRRFVNLSPKGEPQLGRRALYGSLGGDSKGRQSELALLWVLSLSDGERGLSYITQRSGLPFEAVCAAAEALRERGLLAEASD